MTIISRSALVMYQPIQMYDLVNDVEAYPQFLTWCNDVEIVENDEIEDGDFIFKQGFLFNRIHTDSSKGWTYVV